MNLGQRDGPAITHTHTHTHTHILTDMYVIHASFITFYGLAPRHQKRTPSRVQVRSSMLYQENEYLTKTPSSIESSLLYFPQPTQ